MNEYKVNSSISGMLPEGDGAYVVTSSDGGVQIAGYSPELMRTHYDLSIKLESGEYDEERINNLFALEKGEGWCFKIIAEFSDEINPKLHAQTMIMQLLEPDSVVAEVE